MKKILIVTSGQPSLNPRAVKEADALTEAGHEVIVLYQYWNAWGTDLDKILLKTRKWKAILVGGDPIYKKLTYNFNRIIHKLFKVIYNKTNWRAAAIGAITRSSHSLIKMAKKIDADLYIGHNLGAIPAVVIAANYNRKKSGFDAEDFHRNETSNNSYHPDAKLKKYIEDKFIPQLSYLSTASPLISEEYAKFYPQFEIETILNVFPKISIEPYNKPSINKGPLKLFWFSQTIGTNRGIQDVIKAMKVLEDIKIELHIIGFLPQSSKKVFNILIRNLEFNVSPKIYFYSPIQPDAILHLVSNFDIGLAIEPGFSLNNKLALSNKIFTYLLGGNATIFSKTPAQNLFYQTYSNIGCIYETHDIITLSKIIKKYDSNRELLLQHRINSRRLFEDEMNWNKEKGKFISMVNKFLSC